MSKMRFINPLLQSTEETAEPEAVTAPAAALATPAEATIAAAPVVAPPAAAPAAAATAGPEAPVKFTFYFQPEQLRRLDDLWLRAKLEYRAKLNKSEFVRLALERLIDEFDSDPHKVLEDLTRHRS